MGVDGTWSAPGRINLIGEHTDYSDGFVLPVAIGRRTRVAVSTRADHEVCARSVNGPPPGVHVDGALRALRAVGIDVPGVDVVVDGDLPIGAGLASSAALVCATVLAAADIAGATLTRQTLALVAQRAENDFVGVPCGVMDQMVAMCAQAGHAMFLDVRSLTVEHVPFSPEEAGLALVVVDTRVRHDLADGAYAERRATVERAARALGVPALRDVTVGALDGALAGLGDEDARRVTRHVVTENCRVLDAVSLLRAGRTAEIGPLLTASHASLRDDFAVSHPALDSAVDAAVAAGAVGARMTGAGFGGSAIALVPSDAVDDVASAVTMAARRRGLPAPRAMRVAAASGATRDS